MGVSKRAYKSLDEVSSAIKKKKFLAAYSECAIIGKAADFADVHRRTHFKWLESDPEYAQQFADAHEQALDRIEAEALRRGREGWTEPVIYQGGLCYATNKDGKPSKEPLTIRKYDSNLLMFVLKGGRPEKYREYWKGELKHSGAISRGPDLSKLTDEQFNQLGSLFEIATREEQPGYVNGLSLGEGAPGEEPDS